MLVCLGHARRSARSASGKSTTSTGFVGAICGQEIGTKKEILAVAKKYPANHTLMIGDAPGDHKAALGEQRLVLPDQSRRRRGKLEAALSTKASTASSAARSPASTSSKLLDEFDRYLPSKPPWPVADTNRDRSRSLQACISMCCPASSIAFALESRTLHYNRVCIIWSNIATSVSSASP